MRRKPNLELRLEKCAAVTLENPQDYRGRWRESFGFEAVHVELGCGKGRFTADVAASAPEVLLVAIERDPSALVMAMELALSRGLSNVRFILGDVNMLGELFAPGEVGRIYLNFPDPWPKSRDAKLRLTAPNFLRRYASVLAPGGELVVLEFFRPRSPVLWFAVSAWIRLVSSLFAHGKASAYRHLRESIGCMDSEVEFQSMAEEAEFSPCSRRWFFPCCTCLHFLFGGAAKRGRTA